MTNEALFTLKSQPGWFFGGGNKIAIYEDRVETLNRSFGKRTEHTLRYDQIAKVVVDEPGLFQHRGPLTLIPVSGAPVVVNNFQLKNAKIAAAMISTRLVKS